MNQQSQTIHHRTQQSHSSSHPANNLVLIDAAVENYATLASSVAPETKVLIISPNRDGIAQVSAILRERQNLKALHLVSHGSPGCIYLGNTKLSPLTLSFYSRQLREWQLAFTEDAEILIYGCRVGSYSSFIETLEKLTGAKIAASKTPVGSADRGGSWQLEVTTGKILTPLAFSPGTRAAYNGVLETIPVTVNTLTDENDGADGGTGLSLREAILTANADPANDYLINLQGGNTYTLSLDGFQEDLGATGDLDITGSLTIQSTGNVPATIDASGLTSGDRVFHVRDGATLNLENLVVTGGLLKRSETEENGSGILVETNATTILINTTISGNSVNRGGGGIYNRGTLKLENSTVTQNAARDGGGIYNHQGNTTLTNSRISDNNASSDVGGIFNNGGTVKATYTAVSGNTAGESIGGIFNSFDSTLSLTSSTINNNEAVNNGGGIGNIGATTLTNTTVSNNLAGDNGGGIYNNTFESTVAIANSTIANNTADRNGDGIGDGGGITNDDRLAAGTINLRNTIIAGNADATNTGATGENNPNVFGNINGNANNLISNITGSEGTIGTGSDLIGVDPLLGPLQNNGGQILTHSILAGSPAINAGSNELIPPDTTDLDGDGNRSEPIPFDARGTNFPRISGNAVDIGAFEREIIPPTTTEIPDVRVKENAENTAIALGEFFSDPAEPNLTYSIVSQPSELFNTAIEGNTLTIDYLENTSGTADVIVRATDSEGASVDSAFTVTINPVEVPAKIGDTNNDGVYTAVDVASIARVVSGTDSGFSAFPATDILAVGDVDGNGTVSTADVIAVARAVVGLSEL